MSHTPGPWLVDDNLGGKTPYICQANDNGIIATMARSPFLSGNGEFSREQIADNARLIAAAPELLETLKYAREELIGWHKEHSCCGPTDLTKIDAAIAKAEGR
jgi:hypothetical protein